MNAAIVRLDFPQRLKVKEIEQIVNSNVFYRHDWGLSMETELIISLQKVPGLGTKTINAILDNIEHIPQDLNQLLDLIKVENKNNRRIKIPSVLELENANSFAKRIIDESFQSGIDIISRYDEKYPERFKKMVNPPIVFYIKGNYRCLNPKDSIAIIGTREPTEYGIKCGLAISSRFAEKGFVVVSGLARGCDTSAHRGCLDGKGQTVAILAHGLQMIYPGENKGLAQEIIDKEGCLLSEYPIGTKPRPNQFVERDRLQSALSDAVFVIETGIKGGTLHAVNASINAKKPIACLLHPDKYSTHQKIQGNKMLIAEKKAIPVRDANEIDKFINEKLNKASLVDRQIVISTSMQQMKLFE